jgi:hypothetical protein
MPLTKDRITHDVILTLKARGARVRKVHNVSAYKKRRGQVEAGWTDIQGYSRNGVHIECEVKTIGDRLSPAQIERLKDCRDCGGFSYIATEKNGSIIIYDYNDYVLLKHFEK